jgi:hypothetical protein
MACKIFSLYLWRVKFLDNCNMAMKCACCGEEMMPDKEFAFSVRVPSFSSALFLFAIGTQFYHIFAIQETAR